MNCALRVTCSGPRLAPEFCGAAMLVPLWLLSLSLPTLWTQILINCTSKSLCQQALLSGNDVVLQCEHPRAFWYFSSPLEEEPTLLSFMSNVKQLPGGSLQLTSPQPAQTGLYHCQDHNDSLVAEYEIDFQDASMLHVTHRGLGQEPLQNESLQLGGGEVVFTRWEPWQDCNRCGEPGERKRLGYCYVQDPLAAKPVPCWLSLRAENVQPSRRRPELQVEGCLVPCEHTKEVNQPYFIFDTYQLDKVTNSVWLSCPLASIYRGLLPAGSVSQRVVLTLSPQSTMLIALWLLLSCALPVLPFLASISCPPGGQCQTALLSDNDILLHCNLSGAQWFYLFLQDGTGWSSNLTRAPNLAPTPEGLLIRSPLPSQTGFYQCSGGSANSSVLYGIDFQDASTLHVTHRGLGQEPLQNESLSLGSQEFIFTRWEPWQDCNHCQKPGERKRLGYCYVQDPLAAKPVPCWLYVGVLKLWSSRLRPEMQVEACHLQCQALHVKYVVFDNFELSDESESVWLTCPVGSIYRPGGCGLVRLSDEESGLKTQGLPLSKGQTRGTLSTLPLSRATCCLDTVPPPGTAANLVLCRPVIWEANSVPLTWQGQLSGQDSSTVLDPSSGGRRLQIFQPAIYKCFVQQELVARFNPKPNPEILAIQTEEAEAQEATHRGKAGSVLRGLKLMLLLGAALGLFLVLFRFLRPSQDKTGERVLLVQ
ncbi:Protein FAM187B [Galemys pyrenaicus]|uniref:Protein FAM187B n=1 Tax=Galemys pyrenaicus TaxID=202257 RepID=A0A8J6DYW1_GALPY|nr:Protein FAM187B [Galemys pyrenaicus]